MGYSASNKFGKVCAGIDEIVPYIHKRKNCCTRTVDMMDGRKGRRVFAFWRVEVPPPKYDTEVPISYTIYLYGKHYPAYVWDAQAEKWYGNSDTYSRTTTKYMRRLQPSHVEAWFSSNELAHIADVGIAKYVEYLMTSSLERN